MTEETNLPLRKILNNICRCFPSKKVKLTLFLKCGPDLVTCFQRTECGRGKTFLQRNLMISILNQEIKANITSGQVVFIAQIP